MSSWTTEVAPCRTTVPRQSAAVSPPPTMTTSLPAAVTGGRARSPSWTRLACGRYSIAWWTPASSRPGTGRSRQAVAPVAMTTASWPAASSAAPRSPPTVTPVRKAVPSARSWPMRRSRWRFSILNSGMPYRSRPPTRSARSSTSTVWPARVSCWAAARPAGPEPTTATEWPSRRAGGSGRTRPASQAWSAMACSTSLMATGSALMARTQPVSQGAGHSRPVNSGKLSVACSRAAAAAQSSRWTRAFHSGMRLPSGQPWWQKGTPQSMHRPACSTASGSSSCPWWTSFQSLTRSGTGRQGCSRRSVVRNPRGSVIRPPVPPVTRPSPHGTPHVTGPDTRERGRPLTRGGEGAAVRHVRRTRGARQAFEPRLRRRR